MTSVSSKKHITVNFIPKTAVSVQRGYLLPSLSKCAKSILMRRLDIGARALTQA